MQSFGYAMRYSSKQAANNKDALFVFQEYAGFVGRAKLRLSRDRGCRGILQQKSCATGFKYRFLLFWSGFRPVTPVPVLDCPG
jgi:hypothetical protein